MSLYNAANEKSGTNAEEKLLLSRIEDMCRLCEKTYSPRFSAFLSEAEAALAADRLRRLGAVNYKLYGGCENALRLMLGIFPPYTEPDCSLFPIERVKFTGRELSGLSHRDYLGALMSLGLTRSSIGDIVVNGGCAYAMLTPVAARTAFAELFSVGRHAVKCESANDCEIVRTDSFATISDTVASLRLDAVAAAALKVSRECAASLIRSGAVSVNGRAYEKISSELCEGDVMSVRGYGRFVLFKICGRTKKDRLRIDIKKYL